MRIARQQGSPRPSYSWAHDRTSVNVTLFKSEIYKLHFRGRESEQHPRNVRRTAGAG